MSLRGQSRKWMLVRAAAALSCGLVTTIASSWALAAFALLEEPAETTQQLTDNYADIPVDSAVVRVQIEWGPGVRRYTETIHPGPQLRELSGRVPATVASDIRMYFQNYRRSDNDDIAHYRRVLIIPRWDRVDELAGWPALALSHSITDRTNTPWDDAWGYLMTSTTRWDPRSPTPVPSIPRYRFAALPLRPVWPGFAVNTLLYALGAWFASAAPRAIRRSCRRHRGLCERCGYDRRGLAADDTACPECGLTPQLPSGHAHRRSPPASA